jgi:WhiB family redox-sensing transcriptional regulator
MANDRSCSMTDRWWERAACVGAEDVYSDDPDDVPRARAICRRCEVRDDCLLEALRQEDGKPFEHRWGVRGALTPRERAKLSRSQPLPPPGPRLLAWWPVRDPHRPMLDLINEARRDLPAIAAARGVELAGRVRWSKRPGRDFPSAGADVVLVAETPAQPAAREAA